jgi:hypothetical protein
MLIINRIFLGSQKGALRQTARTSKEVAQRFLTVARKLAIALPNN